MSWNHVSLINISGFCVHASFSQSISAADHQSFATAHKIKIFVHVDCGKDLLKNCGSAKAQLAWVANWARSLVS